MLQFLEIFSILANSNSKPLNFVQLLVYVSNDALHAYYTTDQKTFPYEEQSHVDGLACYKQEWRLMMKGLADYQLWRIVEDCGKLMATVSKGA